MRILNKDNPLEARRTSEAFTLIVQEFPFLGPRTALPSQPLNQ